MSGPGSADPVAGDRSAPPPPLTTAAGLLGVQGVITLLIAGADVAHVSSDRLTMGISVAAFFGAYGAGLVACAFGLYRLRPWARGPALLSQLIWLGVAWSYRDSPTTVAAVVVAVSAAIVLAGLLTPASVDALDRPEHRRGRDGDGDEEADVR